MKQWDAFISHASEDKDVAAPLAQALQRAGLKIWLDQHVLSLGDSLREKIDQGLADSRFGIVVLSRNFLAKQWPKRELNGLMAIEELGHKVILPVWHQIDKATLLTYSPILADRLASDTSRGVTSVAAEIISVIMHPRSGSPSVESPTLGRRFVELIDGTPTTAAIRDFLSAHSEIVCRAVGANLQEWDDLHNRYPYDLGYVVDEGGTPMRPKTVIIKLDSPSQHPFPNGCELAPSINERVAELRTMQRENLQ
jgi:hypothetical protein